MRTSILATTHNQLLTQRNIFCFVAIISLVVNLLLGGINYYLVGKERIVVTPPVVSNQFWVSSDAVSDSYLEQMSGFFVGLVLNVSPNNFSARSQQLLQNVYPSDYPKIKGKLVAQQAEIERRAMSTSFHPVAFKIDREKLIVEVNGELRIMVGGSPLELKSTTYQIHYIHQQGRLFIKQFKEVNGV